MKKIRNRFSKYFRKRKKLEMCIRNRCRAYIQLPTVSNFKSNKHQLKKNAVFQTNYASNV